MRILIVDDSIVFRSQIKAALSGVDGVEVVGVAPNGNIALSRLGADSVDLVILDLNMPEMDGIETLRLIREKKFKTKVLIFSSVNRIEAEKTLTALKNGADDFLTKPDGSDGFTEDAAERIRKDLLPKVLQFSTTGIESTKGSPPLVAPPVANQLESFKKKNLVSFVPSAVVIGSSTGGPAALTKIFSGLQGPLSCPIFIVQHMPPLFTETLANNLAKVSGLPVAEGKDGEQVENRVYIAPGGWHMTIAGLRDGILKIRLGQGPQIHSVRPAVDPLFESAAEAYGAGTMAFVLTGMGYDGGLGAVSVKKSGGGVMIQNEESCVVYGMPRAVESAKAFDSTGDLVSIQGRLARMIKGI